MKQITLLIGFLFFVANHACATHYRAGEITYVQTGERTFEVTLTTYTRYDEGLGDGGSPSNQADNNPITFRWGDGTFMQDVPRVLEEQLTPIIKKNEYRATHTYPSGQGASYRVSISEANRVDGILNINEGNSVFQRFYLETIINIQDPIFLGFNTSPTLLQPPIDKGFIGADFVHNPNAFDPDGDSLAYELIVPGTEVGIEVERYRLPDLVNPGPDNEVIFDEVTGDFLWRTPQQVGIYNIAILIKEYRNGLLISSIVRDIQFTIDNGDVNPPTVETIEDTCVIAGTLLTFPVIGDDEDEDQKVQLTATGGPLETVTPAPRAIFTAPVGFQDPEVEGAFTWQTSCDHIRKNPYQMIFRAVDDFGGQGLAALKRVNISVVPNPPVIKDVVPDGLTNVLTWESPYPCEETSKFNRFNIYRREGPSDIALDTCNPSLPGYTLIGSNVSDLLGSDYVFRDEDIEAGKIYCYRVVSVFSEDFLDAIPFESVASGEVCIVANQDVPFVTEVDVLATDSLMGTIEVAWTKPRLPDYDTLVFRFPYGFELIQILKGVETSVFSSTYASFQEVLDAVDTVYVDMGLNTFDEQYSYKVLFSSRDGDPVESSSASSIFLTTSASNESVSLSYSFDVPWANVLYRIYRANVIDGSYILLDSTDQTSYTDLGLTNDQEYCYYIEAMGEFGVETLPDSTINKSQRACATPFDNVPPCEPVIQGANEVSFSSTCAPEQGILSHEVEWDGTISTCSGDVGGYKIYYSPDKNFANATLAYDGSSELTGVFVDEAESEEAYLGCYFVQTVDPSGNESEPVLAFCGESCPVFRIPNTFTPNGDDVNDKFEPFDDKAFIGKIDFRVFNQWGNLVFETEDPNIEWDGTALNGQKVPDAVYHYHIEVFALTSRGLEVFQEPTSGYIHIISGE